MIKITYLIFDKRSKWNQSQYKITKQQMIPLTHNVSNAIRIALTNTDKVIRCDLNFIPWLKTWKDTRLSSTLPPTEQRSDPLGRCRQIKSQQSVKNQENALIKPLKQVPCNAMCHYTMVKCYKCRGCLIIKKCRYIYFGIVISMATKHKSIKTSGNTASWHWSTYAFKSVQDSYI